MNNNIEIHDDIETKKLEDRFPLACRIYDGIGASLIRLMNEMTPQENEYLHQTHLRLLKLNTIGTKKEYQEILQEDIETNMEERYQKQLNEAKENIEKNREAIVFAMDLIINKYKLLEPFLEKGIIEEFNKYSLTEITNQLRNYNKIEIRLQQLEESLGQISDIDNVKEIIESNEKEEEISSPEIKKDKEVKEVIKSDKLESTFNLSQKFNCVNNEIQRNNKFKKTIEMNCMNGRESEIEYNIERIGNENDNNDNENDDNGHYIENFIVNMENDTEADAAVFKIPDDLDEIVETMNSLLDTQGETKLQFEDIFNQFRDVLMKWEHRNYLAHLFTAIFLKKNLVYPTECTILKDDGNIVAMGWDNHSVYTYVKPNGEFILIVEDLEEEEEENKYQIDYSEIAEEIKPYANAMENSVVYEQFENCVHLLLEQLTKVPMESCHETERMF